MRRATRMRGEAAGDDSVSRPLLAFAVGRQGSARVSRGADRGVVCECRERKAVGRQIEPKKAPKDSRGLSGIEKWRTP